MQEKVLFEINGKLPYKNREAYLVGGQIHKRLPKDFAKDLIETFCAE